MTSGLSPEKVSQLFLDACLAELDALKPGNVHRFADGHGMSVADFEKSAAAAAPAMGDAGLDLGARIEQAVAATQVAVGQNTNLGIILLAAPLAQAALAPLPGNLHARLRAVLDSLTVEDARAAYRAIRTAEPGGLGNAPAHDVAGEPDVTLLEAMSAAETKDRIAWNYTHGFVDIFDLGLKWLEGGRRRWGSVHWVTTYVYLGFLAHIPDTLIERKFGSEAASEVRDEARPIEAGLSQCAAPQDMAAPLHAFDASLKERGLNPGTSADLTVATLFAAALQGL
ncbi:triphosphoribosyl-dephospho-CoA synthase [Methyloceanibacter sp.]|uniref:triphosphoribosyl-dephospho-CoA synthase n=1 Tax=Methyloceanibacter sp. TaxID=1965321 RepID=UPI00356B1BC1